VGRTYSASGANEHCIHSVIENLKGKDHLEELEVDKEDNIKMYL